MVGFKSFSIFFLDIFLLLAPAAYAAIVFYKPFYGEFWPEISDFVHNFGQKLYCIL